MSQFTGSVTSLAQMTSGRTLPWARCADTGGVDDPSTAWAIPDGNGGTRPPLWREFVILDHRNEFLLSFDLTTNPIDGASHAAQRTVVREALRSAAILLDTDGDHLPDTWELDEFGDLDALTTDTPTSSGLTALLAYALGQSPHAAIESKGLQLSPTETGLALSYTRRLARRSALLWTITRSQNLVSWVDWLDLTGGTIATQYDGSGTERVTHLLRRDPTLVEAFRLKLSLGPNPGG